MVIKPSLLQIMELLRVRERRVLRYAQVAMTEHQFSAFKTLFFDEFGEKGLESELARVFADNQH